MLPPPADVGRSPAGWRASRLLSTRASRLLAAHTPRQLAERAATLLLLTFASAGASLGAPAGAAAAATSPEFFGTNFSTLASIPSAKWPVTMGELRQGRMTINRFDVRWFQVEPTGNRNGPGRAPGDPGYKFKTITDPLIALMATYGLRGSPSFRFEPSWAHGPTSNLPPESYDDYGRMIAAFAKRYGPGGDFWRERPDLTPQPILTYELWNEANLGEYAWDGNPSAASYGAMAQVVRPLVKAVQPSALILGSVSWKDRVEEAGADRIEPFYIAKLAANGGLDALDGMGFHPYAPEAQSTIDLVVRLRQQLVAAGRPTMPIYADEAGQEAITYDPTTGTTAPGDRLPAEMAHHLFPTDAARGANLAYAGEALAASDCGVAQFLPYGASGPFPAKSTDQSLPRTEAWMGLYFNSSGLPTLSAQALQRASQRWAARLDAGGPGAPASTAVCGGGVSPAASMLKIDGAFTGLEPGCAKVVTSYDGNPLESAYLRFYDAATGNQVAQARTNARGEAQQCVPDELRGRPFRILADVGQTGRTGIVDCDIAGVGCLAGVELRPGDATVSARSTAGIVDPGPGAVAPSPPAAPKPPKPCTWSLKLSARKWTRNAKGSRGRQRLVASVRCNTAPNGARVKVAVNRKSKGAAEKTVRTLWLTVGKPRLVGVPGVRPGERVVVVHRAAPTIGVPRLRASFAVKVKRAK